MPTAPNIGSIPADDVRQLVLETFKGVDLTSAPTDVALYRSPAAPNMMPDGDGFPVKRRGYAAMRILPGDVYGGHVLRLADGTFRELVHAGSGLYEGDALLWEGMALQASHSVQMNERLFILDGKRMLVYGNFGTEDAPEWTVKAADTVGTGAVIKKAKPPAGGGVQVQPANMLSGEVTEQFVGDGAARDYLLDLEPVEGSVQAWLWQEDAWVPTEAFTQAGRTVTFTEAPAANPLTGEDSVKITYHYQNDPGPVNRCRFGTMFGVQGQESRLFISGDATCPNRDFYSEYEDGLFIGDLSFGLLGDAAAPITGYAKLGIYLVTYKQGEESGRNVFLRTGTITDTLNLADLLDSSQLAVDNAMFNISDVISGEGCVSPWGCGTLGGEPLYLSRRGMIAVTGSEVSGRRIAQNRSYYINGALNREDPSAVRCCEWGQFFAIAAGGRIYLLDGEQKTYESKEPKSSHQYEAYYFTGVDASAVWTVGDELRFGRKGGMVARFVTQSTTDAYLDLDVPNPYGPNMADPGAHQLYLDWLTSKGKPICARWETPLSNLGSWAYYKSVKAVWVAAQPYTRSGGSVYYASDKDFEKLVRSYTMDIFNWEDIDFNRFTFNTLDRPQIVNTRKKKKRIKLFAVVVENANMMEPFGLLAIHINYKMGGKIKK